jgi:hypothetical protein
MPPLDKYLIRWQQLKTYNMKRLLIAMLLWGHISNAVAQTSPVLHHGTFKKGKIFMSSKPYKPDDWEKPYFDSSIKTAFPSDLVKSPEKFKDKFIHLIGIVDSVFIDGSNHVTFLLDNKYWDYIEDYSIQDEVMFVSEKGDGKFWVTVLEISPDQLEEVRLFPAEKKLFLVYGTFKDVANNYPVLAAQQVKFIDYELYTTKVFSYEVMRNKNGDVATDKKGKVQMTNFEFLKVAEKGQNK